MRSGAEYRAALRDGRRIWLPGEGLIDDVTTHPATRPMVEEYARWYDRHADPAWADIVLAPPEGDGERMPWAFLVPKRPDQLRAMGRCFLRTTFETAGNVTHTPAYGHLIALGVQVAIGTASDEQSTRIEAYRTLIARTGRFLTFSAGSTTIGQRMRPDPTQRAALKVVRETDRGLVIDGKVGMHTSPAFAEDVYIGALCGADYRGKRATFAVAVNSPGVTVICRRPSRHDPNPFVSPLSSRFDELDGQMWLDNVLVPWERVFLVDPSPEPVATWLFWHQLYCWLAKAEFTLGLALALTDAMGLREHDPTIEYLVDLITAVQTVQSCQIAAEADADVTATGNCQPNHAHVAAGSIAMLRARPAMNDILRTLPGSSLIVAPSDRDLDSPQMAAGFADSFAGGGYTAKQRAALLQLAWDHVGSALDARESVFELHANGGIQSWRGRLRRRFDRYNALANGVLGALPIDMPKIDLTSIREAPLAMRRPVTPADSPTKT